MGQAPSADFPLGEHGAGWDGLAPGSLVLACVLLGSLGDLTWSPALTEFAAPRGVDWRLLYVAGHRLGQDDALFSAGLSVPDSPGRVGNLDDLGSHSAPARFTGSSALARLGACGCPSGRVRGLIGISVGRCRIADLLAASDARSGVGMDFRKYPL